MTVNKTNTNKSVLEIRKEMTANGVAVDNIYVDGVNCGVLGYASEKDKEAAIKAIQIAIDGSDSVYEAMRKLQTNANFTDKAIEPDEEVTIGRYTGYISYANKTLYNTDGEEICNCKELECDLPAEAIKTILTQRAQLR